MKVNKNFAIQFVLEAIVDSIRECLSGIVEFLGGLPGGRRQPSCFAVAKSCLGMSFVSAASSAEPRAAQQGFIGPDENKGFPGRKVGKSDSLVVIV